MNSENSEGLREIAVGPESVHVLAVALRIRGGHDQDKRVLAARTGAQPCSIASFIAGHVNVTEDEVRTGCSRVGVRRSKNKQLLLAVVGDVNLRVDARFLERLPDIR